jgi:hypothetical protein
MECEEHDRHDVENWHRAVYKAEYGHLEVALPVEITSHDPKLSSSCKEEEALKPEVATTT